MGKELLKGYHHGQAFLSEDDLMNQSYTYLTRTKDDIRAKINGTLKGLFHFEFEGDGIPTGGAYKRRMDMVEDLLLYKNLLEKVLKRRGYLRENMRAKTVSEKLFEFERGGKNVKGRIGIGRKHLWDIFRSTDEKWPSLDYMESKGFTLDEVVIYDPEFVKQKFDEPNQLIDLVFGGRKFEKETIEFLDKNISKKVLDQIEDPGPGRLTRLSIKGFDGSLEDLEKKIPKMAAVIKKYPVHFQEITTNPYDTTENNFAKSLYKRFFDPMVYGSDFKKIFAEINYPEKQQMAKIFEDFPEYYKFFRKNAPPAYRLEMSGNNPEFAKDLVNTGHIIDKKGKGFEYDSNELKIVLDMIEGGYENEYSAPREYGIQLLSAFVKNAPKLGKGDTTKITKIIKKNLDTPTLKKYFSDFLPDIASGGQKMKERPEKEQDADYQAAEKLLTQNPEIKIVTGNQQRKNKSIEIAISGFPKTSYNWSTGKHTTTNDGELRYAIAPSGYLRKMTATGNRYGVVKYDPYATYVDLANEILQRIPKDIEKRDK